VEAIDWIESADNYVLLHCKATEYFLGETLTSLESRLDPGCFLRIHRCRIVHIGWVVAVHPMFGGTYELELEDGFDSRRRADQKPTRSLGEVVLDTPNVGQDRPIVSRFGAKTCTK
jgi:DNA-binding LytR/AlgR family response regulator